MEQPEIVVAPARMALAIPYTQLPLELLRSTGRNLIRVPENFFNSLAPELLDRAHCETDPNFLQLLPYIVVRSPEGKVFRYARGVKGNEARLHGDYSIGVGGHVDTGSYPLEHHLQCEAVREVCEEIGVDLESSCIKFTHLLFDRTNAVGQVHLGLIAVVTLKQQEMESIVLEQGMLESGVWMSMEEMYRDMHEHNGRYESWTAALLDAGGYGDFPA